jgi:hypothetical protein
MSILEFALIVSFLKVFVRIAHLNSQLPNHKIKHIPWQSTFIFVSAINSIDTNHNLGYLIPKNC